jgi:hypothetical protein
MHAYAKLTFHLEMEIYHIDDESHPYYPKYLDSLLMRLAKLGPRLF